MFGLSYNTTLVLAGAGLLGMLAGVVGSFAVLRRRALMGDALAHAALPGLCLAFMIYGQRSFVAFLIGAIISGIIGVACVSWLSHNTRIKEDAAIGMVLSVFFGLGIVLSRIIQDQPTGQKAGLDSYLLGQTAGIVRQDVISIIVVAGCALLVMVLCYKEFKILSFDRDFASVQGWPVAWLDFLMMALLVVTTVIGLPAVGVVLMAALLITPGVSARFWTDRLNVMLVLSGVFGLTTGVVGAAASAGFSDLPAGPVIVLTGSVIFLLSVLFAPRRGVLSRLLEHLQLRRKVARQNLLRSLYELNEPSLPNIAAVNETKLSDMRAWTLPQLRALLNQARQQGHVEAAGAGAWRLTDAGLNEALNVVRAHRLWETFLIDHAAIAADHVDRDADQIEHVLSPEIMAELERHLREEGRWPATLPASRHLIDQFPSSRGAGGVQ